VRDAGYRTIGPTVRDGAIVYGEIATESDLPIGWTERQEAGTYRLERRSDAALFGYNLGPHSWKRYLFPAHEKLWTAHRTPDGFRVTAPPAEARPYAFLGPRACELAAIDVQDRVFLGGHVDPGYRARRDGLLRIAVECSQAAPTCFCVSMGTGPGVQRGFDLALTELLDEGGHRFLVRVGSDRGAAILAPLRLDAARPTEREAATARVAQTAASMHRRMETVGLRDLLVDHPEHPRWTVVADRCLSCSNCTMACPTCFCCTTEEVPTLTGDMVERYRRWDSCFTTAFSDLHHVPVRPTTRGRYRQWMTHKLATWHDQFGTSGCVGCGRCITWCPVGIDITEEVAAIRATPVPMGPSGTPTPTGAPAP
jgi:sulfhydrogenase subunit beta (sulfur reductase)